MTPPIPAGPGAGPGALLWAWLRGGPPHFATWPQLEGRHVVGLDGARAGIALACRVYGIGADDHVLAPAYNCGTEIDALIRSGAEVELYRIDSDGRIDLEDLSTRLRDTTRLVHVTHFFGWPQPLDALLEMTQKRDIRVLEDCALALFSNGGAKGPGRSGDAAVFSLPKSIGVPDGGLLTLASDPGSAIGSLTSPPTIRWLRGCLPLLKRAALGWLARLGADDAAARLNAKSFLAAEPESPGANRPDMPVDYYYDPSVWGRATSRMARGLAARVTADSVATARRRNHALLSAQLEGCEPLRHAMGPLPSGAVPLSLPIRVADRARWVESLNARGVPAVAWWAGYHRELDWDAHPEACRWKDEVIALPIHQDLGERQIDFVAECVRAVAERGA